VLAAASEAVHVAGWSVEEVRSVLGIHVIPLTQDPLSEMYGCTPWEPWSSDLAQARFLQELDKLLMR
jgi:hypothetical protein